MARQPADWDARLTASQSVITALPLTISAWGNVAYTGQSRRVARVFDTGQVNDWIEIGINNISPYVAVLVARDSATGAHTVSTSGGVTTGNWYHFCGTVVSASERYIYLNGTDKGGGAGLTTKTPTLNAFSIGGPANWGWDGPIAEYAVWNVVLTDAEVLILSKGYPPLFVRPESLVCYVPLINDDDDDLIGGLSFSATGSISTVAHTTVFYPAVIPPILGHITAVAPLINTGTITRSPMWGTY